MRYLKHYKGHRSFVWLLIAISISWLAGARNHEARQYDLTIVGNVRYASGIERIPVKLISMLKDEFRINHRAPLYTDLAEVPPEVAHIINDSNKTTGMVALITDPVWVFPNFNFYTHVPDAHIKIAYSMIESTQIPLEWISIFNNHFDAVVVPDPWLVPVYEASGVEIPIFTVPIPLDLEDFLEKPLKEFDRKKPFIFGTSAACSPGKNTDMLIKAFVREFHGMPECRLVIHSRGGSQTPYIKKLIQTHGKDTIKAIFHSLSHENYVTFMSQIDCYVQISQGEGFSITPREAMAAGRPCIISNNTAQKTLCNTGLVAVVPACKPISAYYDFYKQHLGYKFDCDIDDVCAALRDVYEHYDAYREKARQAHVWVKKYLDSELKAVYKNLIKPKNVILGSANVVTDEALTTNSSLLYEKYLSLQKG